MRPVGHGLLTIFELPRFAVQPLDLLLVRLLRVVKVETVDVARVLVVVFGDRLVRPTAFPPPESDIEPDAALTGGAHRIALSPLRRRPIRIDVDLHVLVTERSVRFARLEPRLE